MDVQTRIMIIIETENGTQAETDHVHLALLGKEFTLWYLNKNIRLWQCQVGWLKKKKRVEEKAFK